MLDIHADAKRLDDTAAEQAEATGTAGGARRRAAAVAGANPVGDLQLGMDSI
jgi:hypothetical protein